MSNGQAFPARGWFRKKPVEIYARQLTERCTINTREGELVSEPGDWLITGVEGEVYPCGDSISRKTYEVVRADVDGEPEDPRPTVRVTIPKGERTRPGERWGFPGAIFLPPGAKSEGLEPHTAQGWRYFSHWQRERHNIVIREEGE